MLMKDESPMVAKQPVVKHWSIWLMVLLAVALIGGVLSVVFWLKPDTTTGPQADKLVTEPMTRSTAPLSPSSQSSLPNSPSQTVQPLPKSLQGTSVDGELIIDENKQLVVTAGLRRLFDYFLSAQGEESLPQIEQRVTDYILSHAPEPAASQALTIFKQYLRYLKAVSDIDSQLSHVKPTSTEADFNVDLIKSQLQAVKQQQMQYFDAKTQRAFFGEEQALNDYTLQVVEANQNTQLTTQQRQDVIEQARNTYIGSFENPNVQKQLIQQQNIEKLLAETQQLQQRGASQSELNAMRSKYVPVDAVKRLEQLDISEANFKQRVNAYKIQRQQLINEYGETPQAQQQIKQLAASMFSPQEQLRLDVLTRQ